jgi:hypothetical protein
VSGGIAATRRDYPFHRPLASQLGATSRKSVKQADTTYVDVYQKLFKGS